MALLSEIERIHDVYRALQEEKGTGKEKDKEVASDSQWTGDIWA